MDQDTVWLPHVGFALSPPIEGVADFTGIGGSFRVESVAGLPWNGWQLCYGISGNIRPEYATHIYRTREERREAGIKHEITPWLSLSGLAEIEASYNDYSINQGDDDASGGEDSATLQLSADLNLFNLAVAEFVLEYDTNLDKTVVDEAIITFAQDPWELSLGRQYTPFGVYYSNFVSGPLLEFGETRANSMTSLAYGPSDQLDLIFAVYQGAAREQASDAKRWDWAFALESEINENWSAGWSYQSDLSDADSRPLEETDNRYTRRVPGISAYIFWAGRRFEVTLEAVAATRSFNELDSSKNQPRAWNVEIVHFIDDRDLALAVRLEGSEELEDEPRIQFGTALTWRLGKNAYLILEYLHGEFEDQLATNNEDEPYEHVDRVSGKFSLAF